MVFLPSEPGAYALQLRLLQPQQLRVGQLGTFSFAPGEYIYMGSAHGPSGLRARLGRHISMKSHTTPRWHIDYLTQVAQVSAYCYLVILTSKTHPDPIECVWSQALSQLPDVDTPVPGFGASDCRSGCPAHLVLFQEGEFHRIPKLIEIRCLDALAASANVTLNRLHYQVLL